MEDVLNFLKSVISFTSMSNSNCPSGPTCLVQFVPLCLTNHPSQISDICHQRSLSSFISQMFIYCFQGVMSVCSLNRKDATCSLIVSNKNVTLFVYVLINVFFMFVYQAGKSNFSAFILINSVSLIALAKRNFF